MEANACRVEVVHSNNDGVTCSEPAVEVEGECVCPRHTYAHRLAYMVHHDMSRAYLEAAAAHRDCSRSNYELSHLCGNKLCNNGDS